MTAKMVTEQQMKDFLCARTGHAPTPYLRVIGRVDQNGELVAVVGYDNYTGTAIEMHVASLGTHWMTKGLLQAAFDYPFNVCKCDMVLGIVPSGNKEALRLNEHLGFKTQAVIEGAHPDGALHILTMRRDECRWLKKEK